MTTRRRIAIPDLLSLNTGAPYVVVHGPAVFLDESGRVDPAARIASIARADERGEEFSHLKMQVRPVTAIGVSDRGDLVAAPDFLADLDKDLVQVAIIRLHIFPLQVLHVGMENDDDVAPAGAAVAREKDAAVGHRVNGIAEIAILTADAIQVVAEMAVFRERLGVVGERAMLAAQGKIEAVRERQ